MKLVSSAILPVISPMFEGSFGEASPEALALFLVIRRKFGVRLLLSASFTVRGLV